MTVLVNGVVLKRGDIVIVDLSDNVGAEIGNGLGARSCIVLQNDRGNSAAPTTIVVPLSEKNQRALPILVHITADALGPGGKDSVAHCEQVRTVDIGVRVKSIVGRVGPDTMARIEHALSISFGIRLPT